MNDVKRGEKLMQVASLIRRADEAASINSSIKLGLEALKYRAESWNFYTGRSSMDVKRRKKQKQIASLLRRADEAASINSSIEKGLEALKYRAESWILDGVEVGEDPYAYGKMLTNTQSELTSIGIAQIEKLSQQIIFNLGRLSKSPIALKMHWMVSAKELENDIIQHGADADRLGEYVSTLSYINLWIVKNKKLANKIIKRVYAPESREK